MFDGKTAMITATLLWRLSPMIMLIMLRGICWKRRKLSQMGGGKSCAEVCIYVGVRNYEQRLERF